VKKTNPQQYESSWEQVRSAAGILIPGGFGDRGIEGKILAIHYARTHKVPFLGVCLGLQLATIEFCRNVLNLTDANSTEFNPDTKNPVVVFMPEISKIQMGGTMRLGKRTTVIKDKKAKVYALYGYKNEIEERHRHRYEVNIEYVDKLEAKGLHFVGHDTTGKRMEILEMDPELHPYFVGVQYHPEFKTRADNPTPVFYGLLLAAAGKLEDYLKTHPAPSK